MNFKSIFLFILSNISMADIAYQDGYSTAWYLYDNNWNTSTNQTITFSQLFSRVPKVFVIPLIIESELNSTSVGFEISIVSITISNFIVNLFSSKSKTKNLAFKWVAIDDLRIEVLPQFSVLPESTNLTHTNVNAKKGIIILTSFAGSTSIDFTLDLGLITDTLVEVKIASSGLEKIGYIVILGPDEFFTVSDKILLLPKNYGDSTPLNYNFTVVANKVQLFYMQSFAFNPDRNLRIQLLPFFSVNKCSYTLCSWSSSAGSFTKFTHQQALISFDLFSTIKLLQFKKSRISSYYSFQQLNVIELTIDELSLTFKQPIDQNHVFIHSSYSQITFILKVKCIQNYEIIGKYYQCQTSCSYKQTKHFCFLSENILRISVLFQQQMVAHEQLYVTMTANQIQIYQTIVNQFSESIIILQFDII